ncbi:MAG: hypothetical protein CO182_08935, partial [Lysobacterales bacterium CG_4_9_14_3_um_filter_62_6]
MRAQHKESTRPTVNRITGWPFVLLAGLATLTASAADPDNHANDAAQAARQAILRGEDPGAFVAQLRAEAALAKHVTAATVVRPLTSAPASTGTALERLAARLRAANPSRTAGKVAKSATETDLAAPLRLALGEAILLQAGLAEIGERVRTSANPSALARWQAADADQGQRLRSLESVLRSAIADTAAVGKSGGSPNLAALRGLLQKVAAEPTARVLGVRSLPVAPPDFAPRPLPITTATAPSFASTSAAPGSALDLAASADTELSPAILEQARVLEFEPVHIHDFVRSQIRTEWYAGAQKGATETLRSGGGNDADQASLLIALLHASSMPARYVKGVIELNLSQLGPMLGLTSAADIGRALAAAGIAAEPVVQGGAINGFRVEHIFVSA